jgi:hypothetical protein
MDVSINEINRLAWEANTEEQENNIKIMINVFRAARDGFKSFGEIDAYRAQSEINLAQRRLRELQLEIEKQEKIIRDAEKTIRKFKRHAQAEQNSKGKGRPANSEYNTIVCKKFVSKWVSSLMDALEAKSCQQLEQLLGSNVERSTERNWRRWLRGEALPTYNTFVSLQSAKIEFGKHAGKLLQDITTIPNSNDLQTLLRYI